MPDSRKISLQGHQTSTGHRIPGHEDGAGKCARLHGHTYSFDVHLASEALDENGFVVDFGALKALINRWDHRTLLYIDDPLFEILNEAMTIAEGGQFPFGIIPVPWVPTSEHMAHALGVSILENFAAVQYAEVTVRESQSTSATVYVDKYSAMEAAHVLAEVEVLGCCPHGVNLDREFCPDGCRV